MTYRPNFAIGWSFQNYYIVHVVVLCCYIPVFYSSLFFFSRNFVFVRGYFYPCNFTFILCFETCSNLWIISSVVYYSPLLKFTVKRNWRSLFLYSSHPELLAPFPKWKTCLKLVFSLGERREEFRMVHILVPKFDIYILFL